MIPTQMVIGVVWSKDSQQHGRICLVVAVVSWSDKCEPLDSDF